MSRKINSPIRYPIPVGVRNALEMMATAISTGSLDPMSALEQAWDLGAHEGKVKGMEEARETLFGKAN